MAIQKLAAASANTYNLNNWLPFGSTAQQNVGVDKGGCVSSPATTTSQRSCNYKGSSTVQATYNSQVNTFAGLGYCSFRENATCGPTTFAARYWYNPIDGLLYQVDIDGNYKDSPPVTKPYVAANYQMDAFGFYRSND